MPAERVRLQDIKALTLYSDKLTTARRSRPIAQLTCVGKACTLYQPDAVQCVNVGGQGTDVNWKCEADLPEALRFGRVTVSCEGWSESGDPYVLKGSCGLEYRLVQIPNKLNSNPQGAPHLSGWSLPDVLFGMLYIAIGGWMLYSFLAPCFQSYFQATPRSPRDPPNRRPPPNSWFGGGRGGGGSGRPRPPSPPPPYSKHTSTHSTTPTAADNWTPGFWTGLGLGGAATYLANSYANNNSDRERQRQSERAYDWEGDRTTRHDPRPSPAASRHNAMGMGEGSSSSSSGLGSMRRATGVGESNVR